MLPAFWGDGLDCFWGCLGQAVPSGSLPSFLGAAAQGLTPFADTSALRLLGYMDTLVHFDRFPFATLGKTKIDSSLTKN